jgi:hypothetical protein
MQTSEDRALTDLCNAWNELCPSENIGIANLLIDDMIRGGITDKREQAKRIILCLYEGLTEDVWLSVKKL